MENDSKNHLSQHHNKENHQWNVITTFNVINWCCEYCFVTSVFFTLHIRLSLHDIHSCNFY